MSAPSTYRVFQAKNLSRTRYTVPHIVRPGETLSSNGVDRKIGGKGSNVSAAIGLGLGQGESTGEGSSSGTVCLAGSIGQDEWLVQELRKRNVQTGALVMRDDVKTGTAYIQVAEDGENSMCVSTTFSSSHTIS